MPDPSCGSARRAEIRLIAPTDSMEELTRLIHAAYAPHAQGGLRFWATHQSVEDTRRRFAAGQGLIAVLEHTPVGTLTLRPPQPGAPLALFRDPGVWTIGQFAVAPAFKGRGLGRLLHEEAVRRAILGGGHTLALDTAEPATALIRKYQEWGYRVVGHCDWRPNTNYPSVVMALPLATGAETGMLSGT